jgi:hypothetical protein
MYLASHRTIHRAGGTMPSDAKVDSGAKLETVTKREQVRKTGPAGMPPANPSSASAASPSLGPADVRSAIRPAKELTSTVSSVLPSSKDNSGQAPHDEIAKPQNSAESVATTAASPHSAVQPPATHVAATKLPGTQFAAAGAENGVSTEHHLNEVTLRQATDGLTIAIRTEPGVEYRSMTLENPKRVVIDLPNCRLTAAPPPSRSVEGSAVVAVRVSQFRREPPVVRMVLDVVSIPQYEIHPIPTGLEIRITGGRP